MALSVRGSAILRFGKVVLSWYLLFRILEINAYFEQEKQKLYYGYNILFTHQEEERVCSCVYQGPVLGPQNQYTSVYQFDGFDSEVESVTLEQEFQEFLVFAGRLCVV